MKLPKTLFLSGIILAFAIIMAAGQSHDRYGGRLDLHFDDGTGYFRLGKMGGKHFLITPEGNAFKAIGINHTHMTQSTEYGAIIEDLRSMGFNSGDYQGPKWMWDRIPYTKGVNLLSTSIWLPEERFKFEDVFDPVFLSALEDKIKGIVFPQAENKMLIAYFLTDVPVWSIEKYGQGWIDFFKSLDNSAPGKIEWDTWKAANPDAPEEKFIPRIARQVYSKGTSLIRKYDNNHLIFSDRYLEHYFSIEAAREVLPYVDGIATQPRKLLSMDYFETLFEELGKPLFIADHVSSYATEEYPNTMAQVTDNPQDYKEFYRTSVYDVMSLPFVVGYNKCQYMDEVNGSILKQGLYRVNGEPYEYLDGLNEANTRALDEAYSLDMDNAAQ